MSPTPPKPIVDTAQESIAYIAQVDREAKAADRRAASEYRICHRCGTPTANTELRQVGCARCNPNGRSVSPRY